MLMLKNVVFFGTEHFSAPTLIALIDAGHHIAYVVTKPNTRRGRGKIVESPAVKKIAEAHNIDVLQPHKMSEIIPDISALDTPIGVLVAFGKIIPQIVIDLFTPGIINIHPSLLPHYRGPSPIEAVILSGESKTGISIMKLSAEMDAGPVYTQMTVPLSPSETKTDLYSALSSTGAQLLIDQLPNIVDGSLQPVAQDESDATYCSLLTKKDGVLDPLTKNATELEREVRAYAGFPKSRTTLFDQEIIVTKSHVASSAESLVLECKDTTQLAIDEIIAPSGKKMNADAFIRGYKSNT